MVDRDHVAAVALVAGDDDPAVGGRRDRRPLAAAMSIPAWRIGRP